MTTPVEICFAFILAAVFNQNLPGIKVFRTIFYIPVCISMAMATTVWALMMNPYQGLLNTFLGYFGIGCLYSANTKKCNTTLHKLDFILYKMTLIIKM